MTQRQIENADKSSRLSDANLENILPRRGWQDKKALLKAVIKAKQSLDLAEISILLD